MMKRLLIALLAFAAATAPAFAHLDPAEHSSFMAGFSHPFLGLDHVLVMVAVGLWAATLGGRAMLMVPAGFVVAMALGFAAALLGSLLPLVEPVILASVVFVGLMVVLALPIPSSAVTGMVAFFALFHGSAHGGELGAAGADGFALGFIAATALLHATGLALGLALSRLRHGGVGPALARSLGGATALGGLWLALAG